MDNKHVKTMFKVLRPGEMKVKTREIYLTSARITISKKNKTDIVMSLRGRENLYIATENLNLCSHYVYLWRFLKKLKIELPYDLHTLLPYLYLKDHKSVYHRNTYTSIFSVAL